ncbi:MAG: leucyl aminopeptidase [Candidatus Muproteobacteria bacterium RIFCSPHIGHO2_01_FULL_65_16]|uniref:Probable cytosol aminopeptidase n=2 Tax=Candidatus Muproteobacteria TaxID=1817795 RepID=A0A1F6TL80_9PROT|nr:MAG: leucyl aminopeptidase [Candidatus Muproteobacteria bacterium RIFCSPHIGHO2_01_FULL_65_16]OGI51317.1 MAG: leucyl aminopeptidase [Candidatus Muproteobacteria bacterium RIFCSPHIGHO2_02_FULL_65_16]
MDFSVKSGTPEKQRSGCLIAGVFEARKLSAVAGQIDAVSGGAIAAILRRGDLEGKKGQTLLLHNIPNLPSERVLLVGCGKEKEFDEGRYREVTATALNALKDIGATEITSYLTELEVRGRDIAWKVRQAVEVSEAALYRFDQLKSKPDNNRRALRKVVLAVPKRSDLAPGELAIKQGKAVADGVKLARDLGNLPGNICTPTYLAEQALALGKQHGLKASVLDKEEMEKLGMRALLSVARGSRQPPKFVILEYSGGKDGEPPVVLVGKGLTFDAGGISIKPAAHMDEMKFDMCGAAAVLGALQAAAELKLPLNVVGLIPSSENLPDGDANKPGDVVTTMSGQTVEILNTDAEGRLILCDALTYAERYQPAAVIDIATLTGACVVALGNHPSGLMSNNDQLAREIVGAGKYTYDRAWQLPLWDEYQKQIESPFADMANVGGREAGAITGACFLARYAKQYKWAHLDIAGTAWKTGKEKGATGRPVPLLTQLLIGRAGKGGAGAEDDAH